MHHHRAYARGRAVRLAFALLTLLVTLSSLGTSSAVIRPTSFRDSFDTLGPLPGTAPSDPYEIKRGTWVIEDLNDFTTVGNPRRVLMQKSDAATPKEPVVFVRNAEFRSLSVQVTAALIDNTASASVGIVFRAPVLEDQSVDPNNLYLFSALNTGFAGGFKTGQAYALFKRVAEGYFIVQNKIVHTWADLTKPHDYKVTMSDGHIQAFVDGRLVIEHTDVPSPDVPTENDPLPGLPFHGGSVGLRTSKARAWFDDLEVVADDAYEGRAHAVDGFLTAPVPFDARRGVEMTLSNQLDNLGLNVLDTGFVYADGDFDRSVIRPYDNGGLIIGATIRTRRVGNTADSVSRLARTQLTFSDPTDRVLVAVDLVKVETHVTASCDATTSEVHFASGSIMLQISNGDGQPGTTIGPIPIDASYKPNSVIFRQPGIVSIMAHRTRATTKPQRVESSALVISFPTASATIEEVNVANTRILPRTSLGTGSDVEVSIANAVAGRYCSPMVEKQH